MWKASGKKLSGLMWWNVVVETNAQYFTFCNTTQFPYSHTSAKLIEIQQNFLQGRHGLQELGCQMESNDTLHGSELVPHWVLGPKKSNLVPWGQKKIAQKFLYTKLVRYHEVILWGFEAKIVFGAKQASNLQSPDFRLSVGQKNQIDFTSSKSSLC